VHGCAQLDDVIGHTTVRLLLAFELPSSVAELIVRLSSGAFNCASGDLAVFLVRHATDTTFKLNLICPCVEQTNHNLSAMHHAYNICFNDRLPSALKAANRNVNALYF
jgi:hypothetical protein